MMITDHDTPDRGGYLRQTVVAWVLAAVIFSVLLVL